MNLQDRKLQEVGEFYDDGFDYDAAQAMAEIEAAPPLPRPWLARACVGPQYGSRQSIEVSRLYEDLPSLAVTSHPLFLKGGIQEHAH